MDINGTVGPPYAVFSMFPASGPIQGGTVCTITGAGFINQQVKVRFTVILNDDEKKKERSTPLFVEGISKFLDSNTIQVTAPDFSSK
jgi:hypothetical protein